MFEIESEFPSHQMHCRAIYRVDLALSARKELEVDREVLRLEDFTHGHSAGFTASRGQVSWEGLDPFREGRYQRLPSGEHPKESSGKSNYPYLFDQYRPDRLLLGVIGSQPFVDLAE